MAFIAPINLDQSFQRHEDPWFWTIHEVIAALCLDDGPLRTSGSQRSFPNPQFLAQALEENAISGPSLLADLDHVSLRDDLGIKVLGHRTSILHYIQDLRRQSPKYLDHMQKNSAPLLSPADMVAGSGYVTNIENARYRLLPQHGPEAGRSSISSTNCAIAGFDIDKYASPNSSTFADRLLIARNDTSEGLTENQGTIETLEYIVDVAEKRNTENFRVSKRPYSPEPDGIIPAKPASNPAGQVDVSESKAVKDVRLAETCIIDESGRKRRRLDLSTQVPALGRKSDLNSGNSTESSHSLDSSRRINVVQGVESQHDKKLENPMTPLARSLKSQEPGTVIIDGQGRRRMIPISVAHIDPERGTPGPESQIIEASLLLPQASERSSVDFPSDFQEAQRQAPSVRKPHQMYLGLKSLPVDTIFYDDTLLGEKVKNDCTVDITWRVDGLKNSDAESFVFSGQPFGKGLRRYIGARIKHYLMSNPFMVNKQENRVVLIPYPDRIQKKHQCLSATVFSTSPTGPIAVRMDRSKCTQSNSKGGQGFDDSILDISSPSFAQANTADVDWGYLQKWYHQAVDDKILPVYGESGSEGEYDPQTWQEMEAEKKSVDSTIRRPKKFITQAEVQKNLADAEKQMVAQWEATKKPGICRKARSFWEVHRNDPRERSQMHSSLERLSSVS